MLISLMALVVASISTGAEKLAESAPLIFGEPSTLSLALIGIAMLAVYSLFGRMRWRRHGVADTRSITVGTGDATTRKAA